MLKIVTNKALEGHLTVWLKEISLWKTNIN